MALTLKLGRLPAVRPPVLADIDVYANGRLPTPPAAVTPPTVPYPMLGNDEYGDCTIAGAAHLIAAWDQQVAQRDPVPGQQQVVAEYFDQTGGDDTGLVELDVLKTWQRTGMWRRKIAAYAPINPKSLLSLHQAIAFYGGAYLGIACPASAQDQFAAQQPWTYIAGSQIEGGHCIVAVGYTTTGSLLCATWGQVAEVTAGFLAHYLDEAWVILPHQIVEARKDQLGIDLETLQADLAKV